MKGFILPVRVSDIESLVSRINDRGSEYYFGIHIDIIDRENGSIGLHIPQSIFLEWRNHDNTVDYIASCVGEYSSLDFSYIPRTWCNILNGQPVEIGAPQFVYSFRIDKHVQGV